MDGGANWSDPVVDSNPVPARLVPCSMLKDLRPGLVPSPNGTPFQVHVIDPGSGRIAPLATQPPLDVVWAGYPPGVGM